MEMNEEPFFEWQRNASENDKRLYDRVYYLEDHFTDMLFKADRITKKYTACQSQKENKKWVEDTVSLPDELEYFSLSFFTYRVRPLSGNAIGCFNEKEQAITIVPEYMNDDTVILHEMIHLHEFAINSLPLYYHDTLLFYFYQDLSDKIDVLDDKIAGHIHLLNEDDLYEKGGSHDLLFLLKSFDLDLLNEYKLGTVFGYGMHY